MKDIDLQNQDTQKISNRKNTKGNNPQASHSKTDENQAEKVNIKNIGSLMTSNKKFYY